jgi:transglutaminase-like putative cysteine protease
MNQASASRRWAEPIASIALLALSVATAVSMCRVFADWDYLTPLIGCLLVVHVVLWALRLSPMPAWLAVPVGLILVVVIVSRFYYGDTMSLILPTSETWQAFRTDQRLVVEQFPTAVAPVPSEGNFAVATAVVLSGAAWLADLFSFRALGRGEAVVPSAIVVIFVSAVAADRYRVASVALWIAAAVLVIVALRLAHADHDVAWLGPPRRNWATVVPIALLCAGCVSVGSALVGPRLPGADELPLLDTRNRGGDVVQVLSPLVDIRSQLVRQSNVEVFSVGATAPHYWKLASLSIFDGDTWRPSDQPLIGVDGAIPRSDGVPSTATASIDVQDVIINRLGGNMIPAAAQPVAIDVGDAQWAAVTQTLVTDDGSLQRGDRFVITSAIPTDDVAVLQSSTVGNPPDPDALQLPNDLPRAVVDLALEATADATTPYEQARLLQDWFRGNFVYDLTVQAGHSADALSSFLQYRRGYCEHFAATYAAMARALGLPTRVVVGFTPGELGADGRYHIFGRQAHAWVEVWFDAVGWVSFDPTPGRGSPDGGNATGVAPAQQVGEGPDLTGGPTRPINDAPTVPRDPDAAPTPPSVAPTGNAPTPTVVRNVPTASAGGGGWSGWPIVAGLAAIAAGWYVIAPRFARRRRADEPARRVDAAWSQTLAALGRIGAPAIGGSTPLEYAAIAVRAVGADQRALQELAGTVTDAVYSPRALVAERADRAERNARHVSEWANAQRTSWQRIIDRMTLRA